MRDTIIAIAVLLSLYSVYSATSYRGRTLAYTQGNLMEIIARIMGAPLKSDRIFTGTIPSLDKEMVTLAFDAYKNRAKGTTVGRWKIAKVFIKPPSRTVLYVDGSRKLVALAYRGSILEISNLQESAADWLGTNINMRPVSCNVGVSCGKVSAGDLAEFNTDWEKVEKELEKFVHDGFSIIVTGHSQGGAIGSIAALAIAVNLHVNPKLVTFGQPRVGNSAFRAAIENRVTYIHRYVSRFKTNPLFSAAMADEVVTRFPIRDEYVHIGLKVETKCNLAPLQPLLEISCHLNYPQTVR